MDSFPFRPPRGPHRVDRITRGVGASAARSGRAAPLAEGLSPHGLRGAHRAAAEHGRPAVDLQRVHLGRDGRGAETGDAALDERCRGALGVANGACVGSSTLVGGAMSVEVRPLMWVKSYMGDGDGQKPKKIEHQFKNGA